MTERKVKVRVIEDHADHRKGEVLDLWWLEALEATGDGWAEYMPRAEKPVEARETR